MSGHSQFANIKHRKGAQDAKKAKLFTKILREIVVSAKQGLPDPEFNPRLRNAIIAAQEINIPKDRISAAVARASSDDKGENYDDIRYEGYGPGGIAVIVEALTDNRNRTASEVRSIFTKSGGALGETNSVSFLFDRIGQIEFDSNVATEEQMLEAAIEAGASDTAFINDTHVIACSVDYFAKVRDILSSKFKNPKSARLVFVPKDSIEITDQEQSQKISKLVDALEDLDDVQTVTSNSI